ncbi:hypothetical protein [Candidatus Methanoperedens nitratireducens]|uniref:Uncharacterized protein n=1 Tax=Candidatus Methanoperedens nitratireducens TaxID=1392998 RepID=A0A284VT61_9EURY|nr:hypothetical protein [Candidatus Methanoperedens nitroreducens]SNQ62373.1 exported hypothetical protein [Candidatus Methanoperedens nitroreducens]
MSRNTVLELFLIISVALFWMPGALASPQYLDAYNSTFSTNTSCGVCHVDPASGGPRNSYGMQFENQTNHVTNPGAALTSIGPAYVITPGATTATSMVTVTSTETSTANSTEPITSTATPIATEPPLIATPEPMETQIPVETPIITTPVPTPAPSTPGFGLGVFITGLLACYFILKRRNNN